ncbi:hypothetical protein [Luteimonas kalidii]|uniref:Esterase n=1 Tax=Luteimonas kalidii TaxID=3042025 RepID=A0ABT6JPQ0_9GAMM|nr:hypothetical protein [Luteimonas kalidii]MDH5832657.1 hypothetical protein [Luteimonas kalidii]
MTQHPDTGGARSRITGFLDMARDYLGIGGRVRREPVRDPEALRGFVSSRASFIAQTTLYGYMRTRAGQRYPELFEQDGFVELLNAAKWHMWLASLSDLSVYAGGLLARGGMAEERVGALMRRDLDRTLDETGVPAEADDGYAEHAGRVRARIALTPWSQVGDDEGCFHESPAALVRHAPIVETLMRLDEDVVRNSVRYHWQEVRRDLRALLDAGAVDRAFAD